MILRDIQLDDEAVALLANEEVKVDNFTFLLMYKPGMKWEEFMKLHEDSKNGLVDADKVAATFLFAVDNGEIVGRVSIRHALNDFLFNYGGKLENKVVEQQEGGERLVRRYWINL